MTLAGEDSTICPVQVVNGQHFVQLPDGRDALVTLNHQAAELPRVGQRGFIYGI